MSDTERAASLFQFYMAKAWEAAGLTWDSDNDAETANLVDHIVSAARAGLPALDRECATCAGIGIVLLTGRRCDACDSRGHVITDAGREVIAFLRRHPEASPATPAQAEEG